jgi:hypothetical protein
MSIERKSADSATTQPDELLVDAAATFLTPREPRLSIMHLMIWTATSAAMMAFFNLWTSLQSSSARASVAESLKSPVMMTMQTLWAMGTGAYLGGVLMFISRRLRGMRFPVQPGEWLMVTFGIGNLVNLTVYLALMAMDNRDQSTFGGFIIFHSVRQLVHTAEFLMPAVMCKDSVAWRAFFWVATAVSLLALGLVLVGIVDEMSFFRFFQPGIFRGVTLGICALIFALAVIGDLLRRTNRAWVHWVGVVSLAVLSLSNEAYYIYILYFVNRD